ncbi:MAG TPA: hypothetical protein VGL86_21625 [Polyangia bacterium]
MGRQVAYQILRELVWRFPETREAWQLLANVAARLGRTEEAKAAKSPASQRHDGGAPIESDSVGRRVGQSRRL